MAHLSMTARRRGQWSGRAGVTWRCALHTRVTLRLLRRAAYRVLRRVTVAKCVAALTLVLILIVGFMDPAYCRLNPRWQTRDTAAHVDHDRRPVHGRSQ